MKSKRSSHYCAKSQSPRSKGTVFYDLYRLLSRGMVDARQVLKIINVRRTVWHVDDLGDWHRTPDVARGSFTVKKAAANWQSLCQPCHDSAKAELERTGTLRGCDTSGVPVDTSHPWNFSK